jgi:alginate O-acetyltransferase complex protein AlgI
LCSAVSGRFLLIVAYHIARLPERLAATVAIPWLPTVAGVGLCYCILLFGVLGRIEFIYFQF